MFILLGRHSRSNVTQKLLAGETFISREEENEKKKKKKKETKEIFNPYDLKRK